MFITKNFLLVAALLGTAVIAKPMPEPSDNSVTETSAQLDTTTWFCCDPDSEDPGVSRVCKPCGSHAHNYTEVWVQQSVTDGLTTMVLANHGSATDEETVKITSAPTPTNVEKRQGDGLTTPLTQCVGLPSGKGAVYRAGSREWITLFSKRAEETAAVAPDAGHEKRQGDGLTAPITQCVGSSSGKYVYCQAGTSTWVETVGAAKRTDVPEVPHVQRSEEVSEKKCCKAFSVVMICHKCE